jgi:sarcosine oxidase, subunit gamma
MQASHISSNLQISDVSALTRYGVKGPQAAKWLASHSVAIPAKPNTWVMSGDAIVMRLGGSEFLIEDKEDGKVCQRLAADTTRVAGVYLVPRADAAYLLAGRGVHNMLIELCALDLRESALPENDVVMTQVAGISATVLRQTLQGETVYKLWCDGTYKVYMTHTLTEIAVELGGGK